MSVTSTSELLTEAAGVKIYMTEDHVSINSVITKKICITLENIKETKARGKSCGFHLTKSKWDPYSWISYVETDSLADASGLRIGDCLISIDEQDLIGLKVKQIAALIHSHQERNIKLFVWRYTNEEEKQEESGIAVKGPLPEVANKLASALSGVVRALECPVCLESSPPPVSQCVHGHIICVECRSRTPRCPICRVRLGQGRCLLADKLHKIFRDVFNINNDLHDNTQHHTQNLRDRLFGKCKTKEIASGTGKDNSINLKARQLLLTKLFRGGREKAASADNLTIASVKTTDVNEASTNDFNFNERLNLYDRAKSASTGELSNGTIKNVVNNHLQINTIRTSSTAGSISNISPILTWGGSIDSVTCVKISCPLLNRNGCKDIVTSDTVLKHLSVTHEVPQVHFYSVHVKLPLPLPFGSEAIYALHCGEDLFFFQYEGETVWMSCATGTKVLWEWSLYGQGENDIEIKMRRNVVSLVNPMTLTPQHIAPIPSALLLHTLDIQLRECRPHEQLEV